MEILVAERGVPLALREILHQGQRRTEIRRTDKVSGKWIV